MMVASCWQYNMPPLTCISWRGMSNGEDSIKRTKSALDFVFVGWWSKTYGYVRIPMIREILLIMKKCNLWGSDRTCWMDWASGGILSISWNPTLLKIFIYKGTLAKIPEVGLSRGLIVSYTIDMCWVGSTWELVLGLEGTPCEGTTWGEIDSSFNIGVEVEQPLGWLLALATTWSIASIGRKSNKDRVMMSQKDLALDMNLGV